MSDTQESGASHRDDSDYDDNRDAHTTGTALTSPSQRARNTSSMPPDAKARVDLATEGLAGSRCLIENTDEVNIVHYAHCLARATTDEILSALEFSWGMPHRTLNLDTRYNVFRLGSKFHALYDKKPAMCILLPEEHIIQQYYDARNDPADFPNINKQSYKYNFLAHRAMVSVPIHRLTLQDDLAVAPPAGAYTHFAHPYSTFGPITSHVHPRFVICDVGKKTARLLALSRLYPNHARALEMVVEIWEAWTNIPTNNENFNKFKKKPDTTDNVSSTSKRTAPRRVLPARKRFGDRNESPTPASKRSRQGRGQNDGIWLDDETLREHDSKFSSKEWDHKQALISDWTKVVSKTGIAVEQAIVMSMVTDEASPIPVL